MWHIYILECKNKTLYTGATNDLERRLQAHRDGKGAKYTRIFGVKRLVHQESCPDRSAALKREAQIKRLTRTEKLKLIKNKFKRAR